MSGTKIDKLIQERADWEAESERVKISEPKQISCRLSENLNAYLSADCKLITLSPKGIGNPSLVFNIEEARKFMDFMFDLLDDSDDEEFIQKGGE